MPVPPRSRREPIVPGGCFGCRGHECRKRSSSSGQRSLSPSTPSSYGALRARLLQAVGLASRATSPTGPGEVQRFPVIPPTGDRAPRSARRARWAVGCGGSAGRLCVGGQREKIVPVCASVGPGGGRTCSCVSRMTLDSSLRRGCPSRWAASVGRSSMPRPTAFSLSKTGEIVLANRRAEEIFGYVRGGLLHCPVEQLLPKRLRARHQEHRAAYAVAPLTRPMGTGMLLHGLRADDVEIPVEVSLSPLREGSARLTIAIVRDVSEARRARDAATELALTQERERVAHELLDSIVRRLFDVGLTLAAQIAARNEAGDAAHAVIDEIDETIREIRSVVFDAHRQGNPRPEYE